MTSSSLPKSRDDQFRYKFTTHVTICSYFLYPCVDVGVQTQPQDHTVEQGSAVSLTCIAKSPTLQPVQGVTWYQVGSTNPLTTGVTNTDCKYLFRELYIILLLNMFIFHDMFYTSHYLNGYKD